MWGGPWPRHPPPHCRPRRDLEAASNCCEGARGTATAGDPWGTPARQLPGQPPKGLRPGEQGVPTITLPAWSPPDCSPGPGLAGLQATAAGLEAAHLDEQPDPGHRGTVTKGALCGEGSGGKCDTGVLGPP